MQSPREQTLGSILERAERHERQARRRAIQYTLVPIVVGLILLIYSSARIQRETKHVSALQYEATQYEEQIQELQREEQQHKALVDDLEKRIVFLGSELELSEKRLKDSVELSQYTHPIDFTDLKVVFSRYPRQARALELILTLRERNVGWHLGGQTPDKGFDSPSFAMFVLHEIGLSTGQPRPGESLLDASRKLYARLDGLSEPEVGSLVFYPAGYALFYFNDEDNRPFVIGMTPTGITALSPDFSKPVGYRRSGL